MPAPRPARRRPHAAALTVAALASLGLAATARADITVTVKTASGNPVAGEDVTLRVASGGFVTSGATNALGTVTFPTADLSGDVPPYAASVEVSDDCRVSPDPSERTAQATGLADGASATLTVDPLGFCSAPSIVADDPTAFVDTPGQRVLAQPGGTADLNVFARYSATDLSVSAGGQVIGTAASGDRVRITAPAGGYEGPMQLSYTLSGQTVTHPLGTLIAKPVTPPVPLPGPIDLQAIVDISGSMSGTDPTFVRKDAVRLLLDLARPGDRVGAVAFDDQPAPIFDLTEITSSGSVVARLKGLAGSRILNRGGTDYNDGMEAAWTSLTTTPGVDPQRQKGLIFLTDGGHNGDTYRNGHLRFAFNASGRAWPVCVVQLGPKTSFQPTDVARLKRIASDTGGRYFSATRAGELTDVYFTCFGLTTGQRTLASRTFTFKPGQNRQYVQRLPKGLPQATFFVGWGNGAYQLTLVDPKGRQHTAKKPGKGVAFRRGATFAFFRVNKPAAGAWKVTVDNIRLTQPTDRARATVTTPRKK